MLTTVVMWWKRASRAWVMLVTWVNRNRPEPKKAPQSKKDSNPYAQTNPMRPPTKPPTHWVVMVMPGLVLMNFVSHIRLRKPMLMFTS